MVSIRNSTIVAVESTHGDLNFTAWSPIYGELESDTGLISAAPSNGYRPIWSTYPAILRVPIDHRLLSEGLKIERIRTSPDIGSDHLPLIVDIAVAGVSRS